jgi:hypothetical protein
MPQKSKIHIFVGVSVFIFTSGCSMNFSDLAGENPKKWATRWNECIDRDLVLQSQSDAPYCVPAGDTKDVFAGFGWNDENGMFTVLLKKIEPPPDTIALRVDDIFGSGWNNEQYLDVTECKPIPVPSGMFAETCFECKINKNEEYSRSYYLSSIKLLNKCGSRTVYTSQFHDPSCNKRTSYGGAAKIKVNGLTVPTIHWRNK